MFRAIVFPAELSKKFTAKYDDLGCGRHRAHKLLSSGLIARTDCHSGRLCHVLKTSLPGTCLLYP